MNTANRSFALVVATAVLPFGVLFLAGCRFVTHIAVRVAED